MKSYPYLLLILTLSLLISATAPAKSLNKYRLLGDSTLQQFQQQAPADTLFYTDGKLDWRTRSISIENITSFSQLQMSINDLEAFAAEVSLPEVTFFTILLTDMMNAMASGNKAFANQYGLTMDMSSALYLDGLLPVMQLAIEQPQPMLKAFNKAAHDSGLQGNEAMWGGHKVHYWMLNTDSEIGFDMWLVLSLQETLATIALMPVNLPQSRRLDALGLLPESTSVADTGAMAKLRKQQVYMDYSAGFFSFLEATKARTDNPSSKTNADIRQLFGNTPTHGLSPACRQEFLALATGMPRLVFGYNDITQQGSIIHMDGHALLEITDPKIAAQLSTLNGHLPNYVKKPQEVLLSVALGLNMKALPSVFNYLRSRLQQTDFACPQLAELQTATTSIDPSALAMITSLGQGISGIGLAIHDIDINDFMAGIFTVDGLISIAADDPYLLANLAGLIPELAGIVIPTDGTSVPLYLPNLPPGLHPKVTVKGKQLMIFDGERAADSTLSMGRQALNNDGLFAMSADYGKIGAIAQQSLQQIGKLTESDANSCVELHSNLILLKELDAEVSLSETFTPSGLRFDYSAQLHSNNQHANRPFTPGNYKLSVLDEGCVWTPVGYEKIAADGSGGYKMLDDAAQCDLLTVQYNWKQSGTTMHFEEYNVMWRDSCDAPMQTDESSEYHCTLLEVNENSFDCLFYYEEGEKEIYRYQRQP